MVSVDGAEVRALAYPALTGAPRVGDQVLLNVGALQRGLGTGGYAFVVAIPGRLPADPDRPDTGHIVKSRYTPLQVMVSSVEEQGSPHHELLRDAGSVDGMPVVVADLHSALPAVLAGLFAARPSCRAVYVMQDGGALPAWFSRTVAGLRDAGWLAATVTTGQSFGGDLEAVTVHSGLLAARHVAGADVAVVAQGPGNLGTGTRWGFSGVAAGEAVNAAAVLGGRPVASLRLSDADSRSRHQGVSHHSITAYGRSRSRRATSRCPNSPSRSRRGWRPTSRRSPCGTGWYASLWTASSQPCGRARCRCPRWAAGLDEDLAYFLAAAAAGRVAAGLLTV